MAEDGKGKKLSGPRVAEVIDAVAWDYDPESEQPSPLVSTRRYFRDFPWEPEELPQLTAKKIPLSMPSRAGHGNADGSA